MFGEGGGSCDGSKPNLFSSMAKLIGFLNLGDPKLACKHADNVQL